MTRGLVSGGSYRCEFDRTVVFPPSFSGVPRPRDRHCATEVGITNRKFPPVVSPFSRVCHLL